MIKLADPKAGPSLNEYQAEVRNRLKQINELEKEKHALMQKKAEIKRLRNISKSPDIEQKPKRLRSRSASNRSRREHSHERWTNCYARKSVMWDPEEGLLVQERGKLEHKLKKSDLHPLACCGNSPGKSHKKYCKIDPPGWLPLTSGFGPQKNYSERKKSVPVPRITI